MIDIVPYRDQWQTEFETLSTQIKEALGSVALALIRDPTWAPTCFTPGLWLPQWKQHFQGFQALPSVPEKMTDRSTIWLPNSYSTSSLSCRKFLCPGAAL